MTTIKGILTHKNLPVKDASVNLSTPLGLSLTVLSDENGRFEANIIKQAYNDEITIYVNKNNLRYSSTLKLDKRISNKGLNIDLEEYYDSISGKIFTLFEDKPQSDVLVKLKDVNRNNVISKVFTDNSGYYEFQKIPKGNYNIFIETDGTTHYLKDKDNKISEIYIGKNKKKFDKANFKISQINKGIWEQLNFIRGLKAIMFLTFMWTIKIEYGLLAIQVFQFMMVINIKTLVRRKDSEGALLLKFLKILRA